MRTSSAASSASVMTTESAVARPRRRPLSRPALVGALWAVLAPAVAAAAPTVPPPSGRAVDLAEVLSPATESALTAILADLEAATGAQVAVLTIPSLAGDPIESYSLRVAESWGLGSRERDDGVLVLVAVDDRRVRIEVGYGLEGALPDVAAGRIIRDAMVPHFRRGDHEEGVLAGARAIAERLNPAAAGAPRDRTAGESAPAPMVGEWEVNRELVWVWVIFLILMPLIGLVFALCAVDEEARGITFGALLVPLLLGGSLVVDELVPLPPDSAKFLLGGVALLALSSSVFWWLHFRLRRRPETRARWRARLDELVDGRKALEAAAKLGLPLPPESGAKARWLRRALVAVCCLGLGVGIFWLWSPGYAIFYTHNLLWLVVIYRTNLHPSPTSSSSRSWSGRSVRRVTARPRSRSRTSSSRRRTSFRPGGGSFGGGGASGSW